MGTPQRAILKRSNARTCFEPHRSRDRQVVASLASQPTVAGHSGDHPPDPETLRAPPARPHHILIQGNLRACATARAISLPGGYRVSRRSRDAVESAMSADFDGQPDRLLSPVVPQSWPRDTRGIVGSGRRLAGLACLAVAVYGLVLRRRLVCWGASDEEVARTYPGADLIPDGTRASTMAVTIEAPPSQVWPWLVQMGWDRAGWYSWDRLDNGGRPSAQEVHPEWQNLSVGDWLSAWSPRGPMKAWEVAALEPTRFLELLPADRTRLVVGGYQSIRPRWLERFLNFWVYPPLHWTMQTRQFANLKRNVQSNRRPATANHG